MVTELWESFPRLLEQKINALLDGAPPNSTKAFQLYKACQRETLWQGDFEKFFENLENFFSLSRAERHKSGFDRFLDRPMDMALYEDFHLNFRTAAVSTKAVSGLTEWAYHLMRVSLKSTCSVLSLDVLTKTFHQLTHPGLYDKAIDLEFDDFCGAFKKTIFKLFGKSYDAEVTQILNELEWLNQQSRHAELALRERAFRPGIYLTQTEIDWTMAVQKAAEENAAIPKFPLSRGPQKPRLIELERAASLYKIVRTTQLPELLQHRDNIRATILDRCASLLRDRTR